MNQLYQSIANGKEQRDILDPQDRYYTPPY